MSCGCNRPGHGPEPHSPVPLHAPLPSHSAIPLKGGSVFFNVIDHLKRQIDRLFKGKADLVDGKVPEDQLPERQVGTVAWDDVKGKPTEFPPAEHGHPDIAGSVEDLRTTKADATEVTALGARVGTAEAGIEGLQGSLGAMAQTVDGADMRSQNAYAQARDAVGKAEAATLSAGNAYTTAMAAKAEAEAADSKATDAVSKATDAKSIAEDAQVSADDAVGYAELAVRTAESKLDSDGTAADSAKLGGVAASGYALKTDVPKRVSNDTDTVRIDGEGNVYDVQNAYDGGSWTAVGTLSGVGDINLTFTDCKKVGNNYQWTNPDDPSMTLRIEPNGVLYWNYARGGSRGISTNVTSFDVFGGYQFASIRDNTVTLTHSNTNRVPMESDEPTDRLARESQVRNLADYDIVGVKQPDTEDPYGIEMTHFLLEDHELGVIEALPRNLDGGTTLMLVVDRDVNTETGFDSVYRIRTVTGGTNQFDLWVCDREWDGNFTTNRSSWVLKEGMQYVLGITYFGSNDYVVSIMEVNY